MQFKKAIVSLVALSLIALGAAGCGGGDKKAAAPDKGGKVIKIGATAGPHAQVAEAVAQEAKKQGLNVKVVEFSDYVTPDKALAEGELDLASYQHKPFMENFNKNNNAHLVAIGPTILMRMGIYSDKVRDLKAVPDGATVAIPNDPTNGGRGLMLLQKAGLLKLRDGVGFKATPKDVVDNPHKLVFKELEAAQLPRSLKDVDLAVITMNYVMSGGLDVKKQGLFWEDKNEPLAVMILAVDGKNKDNADYQKIASLFHSDSVKKYIADTFKGTIVPAE